MFKGAVVLLEFFALLCKAPMGWPVIDLLGLAFTMKLEPSCGISIFGSTGSVRLSAVSTGAQVGEEHELDQFTDHL